MSDAAERPDRPPRPQGRQDAAPRPEPEPADRTPGTGDAGSAHPRDGDGRAARTPDDDAWATACAEDLAAEKARRRAREGREPGSAAEELRKLADAVAEKLSGLSGAAAPLFGIAAQGAAQQVVQQAVRQARAAVEPVIERNPGIFDHLAAAGSELLAAYRSAVTAQEQRWTRGPDGADRAERESGAGRDGRDAGRDDHGAGRDDHAADRDREGRDGHFGHRGHSGPETGRDRRDEGPGPGEHIDLD